MIGCNVEYTVVKNGNKQSILKGFVVDRVDMRENNESLFSTTGYLIKNSEDEIVYAIAYWRIHKVH